MKPLNYYFVLVALNLLGTSAASADGSVSVCGEFHALGWPKSEALNRFVLTNSLLPGAKEEAIRHFYNIDLDGDDVEDIVSVSCSASSVPADPCVLHGQLSSGGYIAFEAWHLYLIRHGGFIFAVTSDENRANSEIYRVGPKGTELVCSAR